MKTINKLFLSLILLTSFAGVQAVGNNNPLNNPLNPTANLHHQQNNTLSSQACTIGLAVNIINDNVTNISSNQIDNNLKQAFVTALYNAWPQLNSFQLGSIQPIINYLVTLALGYSIESTDDAQNIDNYINHVQQLENTINQDPFLSQMAQAVNTISLNQNLLNASNAIIQNACDEIINAQNQNDNNNQDQNNDEE